MKTIKSLSTATLLGCMSCTAGAQSLIDIIDIEGTIIGDVQISLTYSGVNETVSGHSEWDASGLTVGDGFLQANVGQGRIFASAPGSPVRITQSGSTVAAFTGHAYALTFSHLTFGSSPTAVVYDASWTMNCSVTVTLSGFATGNVDLSDEPSFITFPSSNIISITEIDFDKGEVYGMLSGPRGIILQNDALDLLLVPGEYHLSYDTDYSIFIQGTLINTGTVATYSGPGQAAIRLNGFAAIPGEYDLNSDGSLSILDIEAWHLGHLGGDPVYDTLGDGTIGDEDRAELFRALTFVDPDSIQDCDNNDRHDPFEVEYEGVVPSCYNPCLPDLTGDGSLDFFDVSAFLTAFGNQELAADFTGDGNFDFFDVSAFLSAFAQGCP